ncbi:MAG: SH3 domain-containing protein [Caldilineaceae bacterium]
MKYINVRHQRWYVIDALLFLSFWGIALFSFFASPSVHAQSAAGQIITNTTTLAQDEILRIQGGEVRQLALSPDGKTLAAATSAGLWRYQPGAPANGQLLDKAVLTALWWSPRGNYLAVATYTGTVQIWQVSTVMSKTVTLQSKTGKITAAAWAPDGSQLATGANVGAIELWQPADGRLLDARGGHTGQIDTLLWSADGTTLFSGAKDGSIQVWAVKPVTTTGGVSSTASVSPTAQAPVTPPTPPASNVQAIVQVDTLNIRSGPGTTYTKIGSLKLNERAPVIGQVNACVWLQVQTPNGGQGWIAGSAQFVTLTAACDSIPPAAAPGTTTTPSAPTTAPATPTPSASTPVTQTATTPVNQGQLPANQGCYLFQNQLGAELNVTVTRTSDNQSKTFQVPSGQEAPYCADPGHYTYTIDAPPPWASISGELEVKAGDRFLFPVRPQ